MPIPLRTSPGLAFTPCLLSAALLTGFAAGFVAGCGSDTSQTGAADGQRDLIQNRAAALFSEGRLEDARDALTPLVADVAQQRARPADLLAAAVVALALNEGTAASAFLDRAAPDLADTPAFLFNRARLTRAAGDLPATVLLLERALQMSPSDAPIRLALASAREDTGDLPGARTELEAVLTLDVEDGGAWRTNALYRLHRIALLSGDSPTADKHLEHFARLQNQGVSVPSTTEVARGTFGVLQPTPVAPGSGAPAQPGAPSVEERLGGIPGIHGLFVASIAAPVLASGSTEIAPRVRPERAAPADVVIWGSFGVAVLSADPSSAALLARRQEVTDRASRGVLAFDADGDGDLDLACALEQGVFLFTKEGTAWIGADGPALPYPGGWSGGEIPMLALDLDHEGDLDLVLGDGPQGIRFLRNDGFGVPGGAFVDATAGSGLPLGRGFRTVRTTDLDGDGVLDLVLGGTAAFRNRRRGRFETWTGEGLSAAPDGIACDWDLDGATDLIRVGSDGTLVVLLASETAAAREFPLAPAGSLPGASHLSVGDRDGDGRVDLVLLSGTEGQKDIVRIEAAAPAETGGAGVRVSLAGIKDNRRGSGCIVEILTGTMQRTLVWGANPEVLAPGADILRVTWPNGVVQSLVDPLSAPSIQISQKDGLVGSCPFLYTWNGERFDFVTDVLGVSPLGLPLGPDLLVSPDHDEYVLISGDQLVARNGEYVLQLTEELRETTYLDRVRLEVVDHPAGSEVYPDERFTFPPFPEPHTHTVLSPLSPVQATGSSGRDWTDEVALLDGSIAREPVPLTGTFLGLAEPHFLEVAFDPAAVSAASGLRLLLTGWLVWSESSVNMAVARHPTVSSVPPILQVPAGFTPDGQELWKDAGPPIGFPAGKTKTMVVDVRGMLDPADPRLRIRTSMRIYWDAVRLAVDGDDAPLRVHSLEPASALLWRRGFSEPISQHGEGPLEWFDWDRLASEPRWNPHAGLFTRYGEVLPLLGQVDDRFVIFGAGDALTLRFPAQAGASPPPGWERDFLLYLDGWAKDGDRNTLLPDAVEPLPFHGMDGYPSTGTYPDDAAHRAYRLEWLTRPGETWITPLVQGQR